MSNVKSFQRYWYFKISIVIPYIHRSKDWRNVKDRKHRVVNLERIKRIFVSKNWHVIFSSLTSWRKSRNNARCTQREHLYRDKRITRAWWILGHAPPEIDPRNNTRASGLGSSDRLGGDQPVLVKGTRGGGDDGCMQRCLEINLQGWGRNLAGYTYQLVYRVGEVWWLCVAVRVSRAVRGCCVFLFPRRHRDRCIVGLLRRYLIHVGHFW